MRAIIQFLCILLLRCLLPTTLATGPSPFASEQHALDFDQDPLFDDATYKSIMDLQRLIDGSEQHSSLSDGSSVHQVSSVDSLPPHSSHSDVASARHYVPRPASQSSLVHGHATGSAGASPRRNSIYTASMHSTRFSNVESMKHDIRKLAQAIPYPGRTRKRDSSLALEIETLIEEPQLTGIPEVDAGFCKGYRARLGRVHTKLKKMQHADGDECFRLLKSMRRTNGEHRIRAKQQKETPSSSSPGKYSVKKS